MNARAVHPRGPAAAKAATLAGRGSLSVLAFRHLQLQLQSAQHQVVESLEQRLQVVRTGAGFGVPLETERRPVLEGQPLQRPVEQRAVCGLDIGRERRLIDREAMILTGDEDAAGIQILYRMI